MKFKSDAFQTIYETAEGMYRVGVINEKKFKEITKDCFVKEPLKPVRAKRQLVGAMQLAAIG